MRKLKLFLSLLMVMLLSIGQVWAADQLAYTIEFQPTTSNSQGRTTSNFVSTMVTSGDSYISSCTATANAYPDVNCIKLGSSGKVGSFTLSLAEAGQVKATKVVLSAKYYDSGKTIKLTANSTSQTFTPTNAFVDYELTLDGTADLTTITVESVTASKGRMYVNAIKVYVAAEVPSCTSEITITKGDNPANGTFVIDNSGKVCIDEGNATVNVTATPSAGYHLATVTSTVGTVGDIDGNNCAITNISANTTINVTFAENPKYTVSFNVGGSTASQANITEESAGAGITLPAGPTPTCSADGWIFAGWAEAAVASETTTAPTLLSGTYHPTANVTLYAVYKRTEGGSGASGSVEIDLSTTNFPTSYGTANTFTEYTLESYKFKIQQVYVTGSGDNKKHQWRAAGNSSGTGTIYNTQVYPAKIYSIVLTYHSSDANKNHTLKVGNTENPASGTSITGTTVGTVETFDCSSEDADYFVLANGSNAGYTTSIQINYGAPSTTYYLSAPSCAAPTCADLGTPVVSVTNKTYNGAKLTWAAVANAAKYVVKFNGEDHEVTNNYYDATSLTPSTQYTYQVKAIAAANQDDYCDSEFTTEANFTTEAAPKAHLTLMNLGEEHASSGDYAILTPFNLPTTAAACSKAFVGWDADPDCATAPTYVKGDEFTFANTTDVTLYAVYADETPGAATLTKMTSSDALANGDKIVVVAKGTKYGLYQETVATSYVKNWEFSGDAPAVADLSDVKKIWDVAADDTKWQLGDATNGYLYMNPSGNELYVKADQHSAWDVAWNTTNSAFTMKAGSRYLSCRTDLTSDKVNYYRGGGTGTTTGTAFFDIYKYAAGASTYSNYATTCVAAPTAEPASASIAVAAAGGEGTLGVSYENVNLAGVTVALYNNEACTEAFDGGWLTASIAGDDKHIAYNAQANTSYNDARTAYIKLTAPETNGAANPAVVVIPVEQAKKPAVFASLEDLVAAELASGTEVTVSFSNVMITEVYETNAGYRYGLYLNVKDKDGENDIELFYNKQGDSEQVPDTWVKNGYVSATNLVTTWTEYKGQWELAMQGATWSWENGDITYGAPKAVSSVVVSGEPTKKAYVDGEKFNPAGLTVTVNYTVGDPEVIAVTDADWEFTPERLAKGETEISIKATYNTVQSAAFNVNGLTVGDIQLKTVAEFIAAGNADMRCYLEGIVSDIETGNKLKYGNFNLTDASGTIYVYGCLNQAGEAEHFEDLDVHNGDKIKVIAEDYDYYNTKHEAKNVQFVSKKPVATMTFDAMEMETGDVETIAPKTITEAEASAVAYSIKEGSDDCVSLDGAQITATATGTATIVATLTETTEYVGTSVEFMVTVTGPDNRKIATASAFTALSGDMSSTDISFAAYQGDATNAPVVRSGDNPVTIRMYKAASGKSTGGYLTLKAKVGCTIDQVKIEFSGNADAAYCKDAEALPTEKYITGQSELLTPTGLAAQSVSIVNLKNGSIDVAAITVYYNGDPLAVHHYILGGTYPTEFEQYGTFSYEGLTVTAAYDAEETITEPVSGFTVEADLMTAGNKKAEVYLDLVKIGEYDINVTAAAKENPALAYTPNVQTIDAEEVASWSAPAFSNTFNVSPITYTSNKISVATVDENGVIALAGGYGTAVITATFAEDDDYIGSVATYTITVNEPAEDLSGTWVVATSIAAGDRIIIADVAAAGVVYTMGEQANNGTGNNRVAVESAVDEYGVLTPAAGTKTFLVVDVENGEFALQALNGNYLYAASGSSNHLKETSDIDNVNAKWTITIENGVATIKALHEGHTSRNWMRKNESSAIFSCYGSGQNDIVIYKHGTPDYGSYQRDVTNGNYGTICLPKAGTISGATLFRIADYANEMIYIEEVGEEMEAGKPYIFQATSEQLNVTYTSGIVVDEAGEANGLHGFYDLTDEDAKENLTQDAGNYILYSNQYWLVSGRAATIANFRAYIKIAEINFTAQAPGRRRVGMAVNGKQTPTGFESINASDKPAKMIIDGQIFILRGQKMYDATGRLVK